MWTILRGLNVFMLLANAVYRVSGEPLPLIEGVMEFIPKKVPYSSPVWFERFPNHGNFICPQAGYFADANCKYFVRCITYFPGYYIRFYYQCDDDRVFVAAKKSCEKPVDGGRQIECGGKFVQGADGILGQVFGVGGKSDKLSVRANVTLRTTIHPEEKRTWDTTTGNIDDHDVTTTEQTLEDNTDIPGIEYKAIAARTTPKYTSKVTVPSGKDQDKKYIPSFLNEFETSLEEKLFDKEMTEWDSDQDTPDQNENDENKQQETNGEEKQWECPKEGFFSNPEDCSKFYRCVAFGFRFVKYEFSCPRGTIWDDRLKTCNFRAAIGHKRCKERKIVKKAEIPFGVYEITYSVGNATEDRISLICPTGFRHHPKYCNIFYECVVDGSLNFHLKAFTCPKDTVFNEKGIECVRQEAPYRHACENYDTKEKSPLIQIMELPETKFCPAEGRYPYRKSCSHNFYECRHGRDGLLEGYLFSCPHGQVYSTTSGACVPVTLFPFCENS